MDGLEISSINPQAFESTMNINIGQTKLAFKIWFMWLSIRETFAAITKKIEDKWPLKYGCVANPNSSTMLYQVWPGNNVFFFHGRLICGPDSRGLLLTTISIVFSSWLFAIDTANDLLCNSRLIVAISMVLTIIVLVNLFMVSASDPGIISRNDEVPEEETCNTSDGIRRKRVVVNGVELKLKYCSVCKIFRPPRSRHCAICDNCVNKYDHHCPWIGQCVGLRNYRFYLMFVVSAFILFVYVFTLSCWRIDRRVSHSGVGFFRVLINCPETTALLAFSFAAISFLSCLVIFHLYLVAINQTSYENVRQCYEGGRNPFDKGILCNIKEALFSPFLPSRVNFRAEFMPRGSSGADEI